MASDRAATRSAETVLVNSHYSRESLYRAYGVSAFVCYLGVDTDVFCPVDGPKAGFALSVGAVNPSKGFDFLIRSLALIDAARRPELVIVSNSQDVRERAYLDSLGRRQAVTTTFRTMVSDEELRSLYSRAQLLLYAPVMEPFGLAPLEAMACGTPVVGVREAGVRETVRDGETGLLVDRDPEEYARAVLALLDDDRRRAEMGRRSREYAIENWSWDSSAVRVENHLRAAAGRTA